MEKMRAEMQSNKACLGSKVKGLNSYEKKIFTVVPIFMMPTLLEEKKGLSNYS